MNSPSRLVDLAGVVTAITYPGVGTSPIVRVQLETDSGPLELAFLGRDDIHSVQIGARLQARGTLVDRRGVPTVYDPEITVIADEAAEETV